MALRRKCQQIGDLRIAALRKLEHLFRRLDLLIQDVVMQRTAHLFPEEPGQIAGMQMHFLRQVFGGDLLVHMRIDVI